MYKRIIFIFKAIDKTRFLAILNTLNLQGKVKILTGGLAREPSERGVGSGEIPGPMVNSHV